MDFDFKQKILLLFSLVLGTIVFLWFGKIVGWEEIRESFSVFNIYQAIFILFLSFIIIFIGNWRWKEILKDSGEKANFWSLFKIYLGGYAMMYLLPIIVWGGEGYRVYRLSKDNEISWQKSFSSVFIERILEWTANIIVILLGITFFLFNFYLPSKELMIVFGASLFIFILFIGYFYFKAIGKKSIIRQVCKTFLRKEIKDGNSFLSVEEDVFNYFDLRNKSFYKGMAISFLRAFAMQARAWILIFFLGSITGFLPSLSILGFTYLSAMIPIPTALGSHEALQYFAFGALGISVSIVTAFTMIIRGAEVIISSIGIIFIIKTGFNFLGDKIIKNDNE
ncbi:MAG: lysylphosphatidylglycerol synthase transmembrane domain-containing protein [Candidatus Pacebacteria bacterium]|nr:lysylphosphatidylglycerol synthase transmembrane domain-containing protein [Candidatus Paceibacterota bacterium]MDD2757100.1 lysylphosphatidylglycerol synthase transmembrane domain-containing protein [Candidatus Paceibacterota bacterium]MDD3283629.1 lysylphosphatidylglycerol synthase transmembrane domain-containing protein [Candidatus Paceibacterota bacterium]MDD3969748.1 lysylphosphatidylglycerol synthase transmembrane domain-containing protein [Candidatus Paceibacterota bacterium]MDD473765